MLSNTDRREVLEELVQSPGWGLFVQHVLQAWEGTGYRTRMDTALKSKDPMSPHIVHRTADEIVRTLRWPAEELATLKKGHNDE